MKRTISKITVNAGGLKGLILEGREDVAKNNKITEDGFKLTKKHPISRDLEDKLKEFRFFALHICGLITDTTKKDEKFMLLEGCDVLSLEFEQGATGFFKIKVASRVFDTKTITLTTPKTDSSDGYEWFDEVMKIIDSLLVEVEQYEKGLKQISDEDLMISYIRHGKDKSMDMDKLNEMSAEEKADYCQSILEKLGCLVIRPDEVYEEGEVEEVSLETTTETLILEMNLGDIHVIEGLVPSEDNKPLYVFGIDACEEKEELKIAEPIKLKK